MNLTTHARTRIQQRTISPLVLELILQFGAQQPGGDGSSIYFLDKKARRRVRQYAGPAFTTLDEHADIYAVVNKDGYVITADHRTRRIERDRKGRSAVRAHRPGRTLNH